MATKGEAFVCAIASFSLIVLPCNVASKNLANNGEIDDAVMIKGISAIGWAMVCLSGAGVMLGDWGEVRRVDITSLASTRDSKSKL
jgi:hypothetical protein